MSTSFSHFFQKINQISPLEADFTEVLNSIALTPKMLYFYGKMPENVTKKRPRAVAIVGSRHNTRYGEEIAYDLAFKLAKKGVIIVSGLAFGIDSIAHRGCLAAGGTTLAVLGTPINHISPYAHFSLAAEIIKTGGAVISEYAPGEVVNTQYSFLYRNRIISGLSDIVVVVEAAERSGSLNTAMHALEQGKSVYAVPGNITNPMSQGCNKLIQQGATPLTSPDDILRELFPEDFKKPRKNSKATLTGDSPAETAILNALSNGLRAGEDIIKSANLSPELFNQTTTLLEIKGRVRSLGMNQWTLA